MPRVFHSAILKQSSDQVWEGLREFTQLPGWNPSISRCEIEGGLAGDQVGAIRRVICRSGEVFREQLVALSDYDMTLVYASLDAPVPMKDHFSEIRVIPVTEGGGCFVGWSAEFGCQPEEQDRICKYLLDEVMRPAMIGLSRGVGQ